MNGQVPELINDFNVYKGGTQLIGLTGEVKLPDLKQISETISGGGILGEYESSIIGAYQSSEIEIPFRVLNEDIFSLMNPTDTLDLTMRASQQYMVQATGQQDYKGMRIVVRGKMKGFTPGTVKRGTNMNASVTFEQFYLLIEVDGKKLFELDKLNNVFIVNEVDVLAKIKKLC
ncbi:phage major tail tube protein [Lachnospiraceae bacterium KM106-2]|nr:phage major tail tube protein [Lachnospiraceae bacterium KM106-2]